MPKSGVPHVVLIAGGSGSGKTTLARALASATAASILSVDRYYRGYDHIPLDQRRMLNFDSPEAIEHELLADHLDYLLRGASVHAPHYDAAAFERLPITDVIEPREIVIVEGLFALHWPNLRQLSSLSVYMDTGTEACLRRRMERDLREFGRTSEDALLRYHTYVRPNHDRFIAPTREYADLHLDGTKPIDNLVDQVQQRLKFLTMLTNA